MALENELLAQKTGEKQLFDIKKATETYSEKKAYLEGVKYYSGLVADVQSVRKSETYYPVLRDFRKTLKEFEQTEDPELLKKLSELLQSFFPNGNLAELFVSLNLEFAFDGISEYLMHLKKLYFVK